MKNKKDNLDPIDNLEYEKVLIHEEKKVREAGGLHVIGTESHES